VARRHPQAVEAKEGVDVTRRHGPGGSVTVQDFLLRYEDWTECPAPASTASGETPQDLSLTLSRSPPNAHASSQSIARHGLRHGRSQAGRRS
jgi:preprotein translocase subunit SecA